MISDTILDMRWIPHCCWLEAGALFSRCWPNCSVLVNAELILIYYVLYETRRENGKWLRQRGVADYLPAPLFYCPVHDGDHKKYGESDNVINCKIAIAATIIYGKGCLD
jgi:hypothetical protein